MKTKYMNKKAVMSYSQILILIISMFAFAFLIGGLSESKSVDAQEDPLASWACCEENLNGNTCTYRPETECNTENGFRVNPAMCEETSYCKTGICINSIGKCIDGSTAATCGDGKWFEGVCNNVPQGQKGCCILGDEAKFTEEANCEKEAEYLNIPMEFKNEVNSEIGCIYLTETEVEGACVLETNDLVPVKNCVYTTSGQCEIRTGDFYANTLCSNPELDTVCTAHDSTNCFEEKDEVYWFDSCGNKEEVKEECSIFLGTRCGLYRPDIDEEPDEGDYVCRDLSCDVEINGQTVNKKNGESWCEYEGCIGEGKDPVGSRQLRHICYFGEEKLEACDDFRNQLCVQSDTELADGTSFSEGSCRVNRWRSCYEYNSEQEGMADKCNKNPDCKIQGVHIDEFSFDVCVPNYPPGFQFWRTDDPSRSGELECGFATQTCPVVYIKRISGWKCETNCDCESGTFTQQMNDLCTSLGDCGGYINFAGDYNDYGYSSGAGRISGDQYKSCADYQPNQDPADPGDFGFEQTLGIPGDIGEGELPEADSMLGALGAGVSALGMMKISAAGSAAASAGTLITHFSPVQSAQLMSPFSYTRNFAAADFGMTEVELADSLGVGSPKPPSAFGNALGAAGAGLSVASFMQTGFGLDVGVSYAIGGIYGFIAYQQLILANPNPLMIYIGIGLAILSAVLGLGKSKIKYVDFTCRPWQAPTGGLNCDLCNTNDLLGVPCSEYRCKSLGGTCEFINPRTDNELCIDNDPHDVSSPRLTPLYANISEGFEYRNVVDGQSFELKTSEGGCIPEYSVLQFGVKANRPARCKISENVIDTYDEMPEFFGGKNFLLEDHLMTLAIPSPSAFKYRYNLTEEEVEEIGEINYFIKCESINGIKNTVPFSIKTCVKPGPDLTAPRITRTIPATSYIKYQENEKNMTFYVNEPANCKWSGEDKDYILMENLMSCNTDVEDYGLFGWPCQTKITGISDNLSSFYIRCKDQPWLSETNESRNVMSESYVYNFVTSSSPLVIEEFKPEKDKEFISNINPLSLNFRLKTDGGVEEGRAFCSWRTGIYSDDFIETNAIYHTSNDMPFFRGDHTIEFSCIDVAGNIANASTNFEITIDDIGPRITRIYYDSGLKVSTSEEAECRYGFKKNFRWDNSTEMSGDGFEHVADWQLKTYYIQCADNFGTKGVKKRVTAYSLL